MTETEQFLIALLKKDTEKSTFEIENRISVDRGKYLRVPLMCYEDNDGNIRLLVNDNGFKEVYVNPLNFQQPVDLQSIYSDVLFVTNVNLNVGASYISSIFDVQNYNRITGKIFMDRIYSFSISESDDGITFDTTYIVSNVSANTVSVIDYSVKCRYVKIKISNTDTTATTIVHASAYKRVL